MGMEIGVAGIVAALVVSSGFFVWMTSSLYKTCGPNQAMIVSGMLASDSVAGARHKVLIGGGTPVFPIIQNCRYVGLECRPIQLEPKTPYITKDGSPIKFNAVAQVNVKPDPVSVMTAAECFLETSDNQTSQTIAEIILGHTRAIVGTMSYCEILHDLRGVSDRVQEETIPSLLKFGMTVRSYAIDEMESDPAQLQALVFDAAMKS
ncbi:MAG: hypothetical protein C0469_12340 [Cyanobacteria bacterium DS2.3.42]|nr:hypothetical protein [Cyanobacteria bacterium DS2.3.42]